MKIPKKLKIGGHVYSVRIVEGMNDSGDMNSETQTISICKEIALTEKEETLIHEIMHATNACWMVSEPMHALLEATAQQLYQVLKDNDMLK